MTPSAPVANPMSSRRDRDRSFKRAVSLFILVSMLLVLGTIWLGNTPINPFENKFRLHFETNHVMGIQIETPVTLAGIMIGKVVNMEFGKNNNIHVTLRLLKRYHDKIRGDSTITFNQPMVGNPTLDITLGSDGQPVLKEGSYLPLERTQAIGDLMAKVSPVLENLNQILEHTAQISGQWVNPEDHIQKSLVNVERFTAQTAQLMEKLNATVPPMMTTLHQSANQGLRQADGLLGEARKGVQGVPSVLSKLDALLANSQEIVVNLAMLSRQLEKLAPKVPALVQQSRDVMEEAEVLMRNINHSILFDSGRGEAAGSQKGPWISPRDVPLPLPLLPSAR
ncbi:MAG: MCE family protein [Magnetococcales bacterium]|nr:MCE family protein [Magnetococcales bacterium]